MGCNDLVHAVDVLLLLLLWGHVRFDGLEWRRDVQRVLAHFIDGRGNVVLAGLMVMVMDGDGDGWIEGRLMFTKQIAFIFLVPSLCRTQSHFSTNAKPKKTRHTYNFDNIIF